MSSELFYKRGRVYVFYPYSRWTPAYIIVLETLAYDSGRDDAQKCIILRGEKIETLWLLPSVRKEVFDDSSSDENSSKEKR